MKNIFKYTLISVLASSFLGCGSSQSDRSENGSDTLKEPTILQAHKIDRANWVGVAPLDNGFFVTNDGNLLSFKVADDSIANHQTRNIGIFIDIDDNVNTGYKREWLGHGTIGSDYMIDNHRLYSYAGSGWNWNFISDISKVQISDNEIEFEVSQDILGQNRNIKTAAVLLDEHWNSVKKTSVINYELKGEHNNHFQHNYTVTDDEENIIFTIQSQNVSNGQMREESIFIDADGFDTTGYANPRWGNIGAEYLIGGDIVYIHTNTDRKWSWKRIGRATTNTNGNTLQVTVRKDLLNIPQKFRSIAGLVNREWKTIEKFDTTPYTNTHNKRYVDYNKIEDTLEFFDGDMGYHFVVGMSPNQEYLITVKYGMTYFSASYVLYSIDRDSNIHFVRNLSDYHIHQHSGESLEIYGRILDDQNFEHEYFTPDYKKVCLEKINYTTGEMFYKNCE